jgi:hypothetical protein
MSDLIFGIIVISIAGVTLYGVVDILKQISKIKDDE